MKKIILGISSSIAAYKACDLIRLFVKGGYSVHAVATENALHLVSPLTLETLSGNPVYSEQYSRERREMGHIELKSGASLFLVAPATANIIGKFAAGIADDLLSTTFLSVTCPVMVAPAMNPNMYLHPAVRRNIEILKAWGVAFIEPASGEVVCGDEGMGKLADVEDIYRAAINAVK
ncbi:MAG TPA: flavoprotein [Spirochaetota bacterium]|nr:flavoprotein [Spirochaetota bacterium]HPC41735.1 flavoprotein [Spirochaetota bacterium]HPL18746.1 flavoprotein [Spirochaetota bacterium]HQF06666.1 flavoprotein [Spirochaetota bacterium]HQH95931.1 flavoprotein [Spirochaetota bacterium]